MNFPGLMVFPVLVPISLGILAFILPRDLQGWKETLALLAAGIGVVAALMIFLGTGNSHWTFSYPALEVRFDLHASGTTGLNLLIVSAMEALIVLMLVFAAPRTIRSSEYFFFLLYAFGIANGILLSEQYVEMVLFGELLFVTLYGLVAGIALFSSFSSKNEAVNLRSSDDWANSRIFSLFGSGIVKGVKRVARLICVTMDRGIDAIYEKWMVGGGTAVTVGLKAAHNGLYANYLSWVLGGFILLLWFLVAGSR